MHMNDEAEIRGLIERWAKAVREEDRPAIRADHDPGILMFDVPPPFFIEGSGCLHGDVGDFLLGG